MDIKEEKQRKLQEMLSAAHGALEEALDYANKHDLWFEFTGIRRGPGGELKTADVNDAEFMEEINAECSEYGGHRPKTQVDVLDLSKEWVGSWC